MQTKTALCPDLWLVCSAAAFQSIADFWREEAGPTSLLAWRLAKRLIQLAALPDLAATLVMLAERAEGCVTVVFEPLDEQAARLLMTLPQTCLTALDLRVLDWRRAPLEVVSSMNGPDRRVLEHLSSTPAGQEIFEARGAIQHDPQGYRAGLALWETQVRAGHPYAFAQSFPARVDAPIDWERLVADPPLPRGSANDDQVYHLGNLAAASGSDGLHPVRLDSPPNSPEQWSLSWLPVRPRRQGETAPGYLRFMADPRSTDSLLGCTVLISCRNGSWDLGVVGPDRVADLRLPEPIDLSDVNVRIRRPG